MACWRVPTLPDGWSIIAKSVIFDYTDFPLPPVLAPVRALSKTSNKNMG
jgi:hypothetical protein